MLRLITLSLILLLPLAAMADEPPPDPTVLLSRAVLHLTMEKEQLMEQVQKLQQELKKAPPPPETK